MASMTRGFIVLLVLVLVSVAKGKRDAHDPVLRRQKRAVTTVADLEAVVEQLSQKVDKLQADLIGINNELQDKLVHESQKRHELEDLIRNSSTTAATPKVSFYAKYSPDVFYNVTLNASDVLVVNTVVNNDGQAYDSIRGVFTAPFNGTYSFFVSDATSPSHATVMQLNLMVDGMTLPACVARTTILKNSNSVATGSCQAVIRLQAGQAVRLQNLWGNASYWGGITTFSGMLLHLD